MAGLGLLDVHELVDCVVHLEQVGVGELADLALKGLPVDAAEVVGVSLLHLLGQPVLQAEVVDEADTACAMTGHDARVLLSGVTSPTETASQLLRLVGFESSHRLSFLQLLLVELFCCLPHVLAGEVLHSELYSAKLDHIKLLDFVVLLKKISNLMNSWQEGQGKQFEYNIQTDLLNLFKDTSQYKTAGSSHRNRYLHICLQET